MFCTDLCHVEYSKRPRVRAPVSEILYCVEWDVKLYYTIPSSCTSNVGMETLAPLVNGIVSNTVPLQLAHQSDTASDHSYHALLSARLVPDFVINWIETRAVLWPQI